MANRIVRSEVTLRLPEWTVPALALHPAVVPDRRDRMRLVLALAAENVRRGTGGPFAAAVFERDRGRLLAVGLNQVVPAHNPIAHAEIMALALMPAPTDVAIELVASAEPCAMCLGAIPWSGLNSVVCGARDEDVRPLGFDEGQKPADWESGLRARGIEVHRDVLRHEARHVLRSYAEAGGVIYNGASLAIP